jgi:deoxycytidylate deaminase
MIVKTNHLFQTASKLAETSTYGRFRLGALIAKKSKIISLGTNAQKTHPLQKKYASRPHLNEWRHAEIHAIALAKVEDLIDADIYICRVLKDSTYGNSRPCTGCLSAIKDFGIAGMYYIQDTVLHYESVK